MKSHYSVQKNANKRVVIRRPMTKISALRKSAPVKVISPQIVHRSSSRPKAPQRSSTSSVPERKQSYIDDERLNGLREQLWDNPEFDDIETDELHQLQAHLKEYGQDCAFKEDYDSATKASELNKLVKEEIIRRSSGAQTHDESETDDEMMQRFEDRWKEKFQMFDDITEQKEKELNDRHKKQMDEFEETWRNDKPQRYRKPSNKLLQLKHIEKSLVISGQYQQARSIHNEAENLVQQETNDLQELLLKDYKEAKDALLKKQKNEKEKLNDARKQGRETLESQKKTELNQMNKRKIVRQEKYKAAQKSKERSPAVRLNYPASIANAYQKKNKYPENVIPPLIPPNDPDLVKAKEEKERDKRKKQAEFHKKNAQLTLRDYVVQKSPREEEETEEQVNNKSASPSVSSKIDDNTRKTSSRSQSSHNQIDASTHNSEKSKNNEENEDNASDKGVVEYLDQKPDLIVIDKPGSFRPQFSNDNNNKSNSENDKTDKNKSNNDTNNNECANQETADQENLIQENAGEGDSPKLTGVIEDNINQIADKVEEQLNSENNEENNQDNEAINDNKAKESSSHEDKSENIQSKNQSEELPDENKSIIDQNFDDQGKDLSESKGEEFSELTRTGRQIEEYLARNRDFDFNDENQQNQTEEFNEGNESNLNQPESSQNKLNSEHNSNADNGEIINKTEKDDTNEDHKPSGNDDGAIQNILDNNIGLIAGE